MFKVENIRAYILIAMIIILVLLLMNKCSGGSVSPLRIERYTDTIVKTHIDTVEHEKIEYITRTKLVRDTVYVVNDSINILQFTTDIEDSLLSGTIDTYLQQEDTIITLIDQKLVYTPKFPKYINRVDSVFIKDSTVITIENQRRLGFLIGADFAGGSSLAIVPKVGLQFRNGHIVEGGYDPFAKNIYVGFKMRLGK